MAVLRAGRVGVPGSFYPLPRGWAKVVDKLRRQPEHARDELQVVVRTEASTMFAEAVSRWHLPHRRFKPVPPY
jgi:hypothetical protein